MKKPEFWVLGIDIETTGLDKNEDEILEVAFAIKDLAHPGRPLIAESHFVNDRCSRDRLSDIMKTPDPYVGHGITSPEFLQVVGSSLDVVLGRVRACMVTRAIKAIVAHNGENFDKPFILKKCNDMGIDVSHLVALPWIDTSADVDYPKEFGNQRDLRSLAAASGFVNPFPHAALPDVLTMLRVLEGQDYAMALVSSKHPFVTVQAKVSYEDRQLAKDARFSWEVVGEKIYPRMWVKRIKKHRVDEECARFPFATAIINEK